MSDGTVLLADHYLPVSVASAATVLVRCPYGRGGLFALQTAQIFAERGYHVLLQSVRGTFGSGGEFEPMRHEIADGQDTVAWLRQQSWFEGRLATYGPSYLGFVQWALAMDPPPELVAAVVHVGPHDFSRSAYRNGVFDLYNYVMWSDMVAHQESVGMLHAMARMTTAERRLRPVLNRLPVTAGYRDLLDRYAGPGRNSRTGPRPDAGPDRPVRIWVGGEGAGEWREIADWPPPATAQQRWYLDTRGSLGTAEPSPDVPAASFRYDPADPTPSPGGAIMAVNAGSRDNRSVELRLDVLVFSSDPLDEPVEVIGEVAAELSVTRDNPHADLFVRLCDVDPRGRSRNVCDGIVRLTEADPLTGTTRVSMFGAAHRFGRGHRIRLQVAGGAHPRFARNPGNGQVDAAAPDLVPTQYDIGLNAAHPSVLLLPR